MRPKRLKIAIIAHVRHPIAEPYKGGMEAHCALLVRTLAGEGHDVTLFASGDSDDDHGVLHPIAATAYERELPWALWHGRPELADWLRRAYARAWAAIRIGEFDVVHNNSLFPDIIDWAARDGVPMVTSLHVPPFATLRHALERNDRDWLQMTVTSRQQLALWEGDLTRRITVAHNGIDLDRFVYADRAGDRALWCGRITPTKGTVEAVRAAIDADIALDIVGPIDCEDYFSELRPLLDERRRYLGHLGIDALAGLMRRATFLVCTPCWDEPFGLVTAEAMACGTPTIAYDRGAMREVIGEAGVLVRDAKELAEAMQAGPSIARSRCRERAERWFSAAAMVSRYRPVYERAIAAAPAGAPSSMAMTRAELA